MLAMAHGIGQGAALQVLSFGGFWAGLWVGAVLSPMAASLTDGALGKAFLALFALFGMAVLGGALGRIAGTQVWERLQRARLGSFDSVLGGAVAGGASLIAVWLIAVLLSSGPTAGIAGAIHDSKIVRWMAVKLPPAPSVFSRIQSLLDESKFPQVFAGLEPRPPAPVPIPDDPTVQAAVAAAGASTVKVVGFGCGGVQSGSGFAVSPTLVVTNAHVVAGIDEQRIELRNGRRFNAVPVVFDPALDVAVLRTTSPLPVRPLPLLRGDVPRGTGGAVLGYPGGGGFTAGPGAVLRQFNARGRDIYGAGLTERQVYQLQAVVRQGNSGGPFARADGAVLGVIFAASTTDPNLGYALTGAEVGPRVDQAAGRTGAADTGSCAA